MFSHSRASPQASPEGSSPRPNNNGTPPNNSPTSPGPSPTDNRADISQPSSSASRPRMSKDSEGYPSWLPKRPPPPAPASTMHSSVGVPDLDPETDPEQFASLGGRKPAPRSVRIVSLHGVSPAPGGEQRDERHEHARLGHHSRAWSRATAPPVLSSDHPAGGYPYYASTRIPQPKFNAKGLHLEHLYIPSIFARLYFYIFPILAFAHIPLQTFFDFNAVYILIQVSRYPNPEAPGVPGSGKNWALAAAAYIACWLVWIIVVFLLYELVYSFIRRWRAKRPPVMPIYLSSPAFTFVSMTSYTNFCFFLHLRTSAFVGGHGTLRDGLAETFYWYSQNLPTVALLIPRAGLSLALLLAFSQTQAETLSLASMGINNRDATFFRRADGTLTGYARGVLIANATWAAWRILVLLVSWIGLWILSGQGCAGLCGPRYRWEEEEAEKTRSSIYSTETDSNRDIDALAWSWKECTRLRVQDLYELCLTSRPALRWGGSSVPSTPGWGQQEKGKEVVLPEPDPIEVQRVLAAVGIPSVPPPARRRVLTEDFFESPKEDKEIQLKRRESDKGVGTSGSGPLLALPYPFSRHGSAQVSSQDKVPFPPSPSRSRKTTSKSGASSSSTSATSDPSSGTGSQSTGSGSGSGSTEEDSEEEEEDDDNDDDDDDDDDEEEDEDDFEGSEERGSNSMSSLGQPVSPSRGYPFGHRRPAGRGNSTSSRSHRSRPSQSGVSQSGVSYSGVSQSTGNVPSTDSTHSVVTSSSSGSRPRASMSQSSGGSSGIPMPPRHPNVQARTRAPSAPLPLPPLPASAAATVAFPSVRLRADSGVTPGVSVGAELMHDGDAESVAGSEEGSEEGQDSVGLLSPGASNANLAVPGTGPGSSSSRSRTGSSARSRANSARSARSHHNGRSRVSSLGAAVRSHTQSLLHSVSATSLELVRGARSRTNSSMARLEEESAHPLPELPTTITTTRSRDVSGSTTQESQESQMVYPYSYANPQAWEDRGYLSSSSHSHSRSGSGSGSGGENWTFGQPIPFMRPGNSHLREEVLSDSEHEGGVSERRPEMTSRHESEAREVTHDFGPPPVAAIPYPTIAPRAIPLVGPGMPGPVMMTAVSESPSVSVSSADVFLSPAPSTRTASPLSAVTPREGEFGASQTSAVTSPGSPGIDIPWGPYRLHEPRGRGGHVGIEGSPSSSSSPHVHSVAGTSPPDISSAAQSFVTAPATIDGSTTTEGSGERTEHGSLNESSWNAGLSSRDMRGAGIGNVGLGTGGLGPERKDAMGDWRVR